ncbi:MAG: DNA-binding Lrp family transcriptional regulator [Gammaproteobacteria bacterium]|jgi:DNA-binding Lrp family transcriptional regulator
MLLDRFDIAILKELQVNGRISNRDLAERVGLSQAPCWRRLRALEEQSIISHYAAILNAENLGLSIIAFAHISLENHHASTVAEFDKAIQSSNEVLECYMTSGEYDYMLKVVAADMAAYESFLSDVLMQIAAVRNVSTSFALRHKKLTTALPLTGF